jgi:DNA replication licensing factor MCM2
MIRIAEASARMHLRQYVYSDDVDLAIQVALDSFISAQKHSVMEVLRKVYWLLLRSLKLRYVWVWLDIFLQQFSKYVNVTCDNFELMDFTLKAMVKEKVRFYQLKFNEMPISIAIDLEDFRSQVWNLFEIAECLWTSNRLI